MAAKQVLEAAAASTGAAVSASAFTSYLDIGQKILAIVYVVVMTAYFSQKLWINCTKPKRKKKNKPKK